MWLVARVPGIQFAGFFDGGTASRTRHGKQLVVGQVPNFHHGIMQCYEYRKCVILLTFCIKVYPFCSLPFAGSPSEPMRYVSSFW
jgi:hypothetical protein